MKRDHLFIARDLMIILVILGIGLMVWQPALRNQVIRALPTDARETGEHAARWVSDQAAHLPWGRQEAKPAESVRPPASPPATEPVGEAVRPEEEDQPAPPEETPEQPETPPDEPTPAPPVEEPITPAGNLLPRLPSLREAPPLSANLRSLQSAATSRPSASAYRKLADAAAAAGFSEAASAAYLKEAAVYQRLGDANAAAVEALKAGRYKSEAALYLHQPQTAEPSASLARLEPAEGVLTGAFIDRDERLATTFMDENWQTHRDPSEFAELVGKKPASLFCYLNYGKPFPTKWAERLKEQGVIPHLAWEPKRLADVTEDAYLDRFVADVARFDFPVFLRFAGEMNGEWTPYHGNPALYRQR